MDPVRKWVRARLGLAKRTCRPIQSNGWRLLSARPRCTDWLGLASPLEKRRSRLYAKALSESRVGAEAVAQFKPAALVCCRQDLNVSGRTFLKSAYADLGGSPHADSIAPLRCSRSMARKSLASGCNGSQQGPGGEAEPPRQHGSRAGSREWRRRRSISRAVIRLSC